MKVKYETETPWIFQLNNFLEDRGLATSDVTEVIMLVKNSPTDADAAALLSKTMSAGEIVFPSDDAIAVDIDAADFGSNLEIGGTYYVYLGLTATGYTGSYLEVGLRDNTLSVVQDGIRG